MKSLILNSCVAVASIIIKKRKEVARKMLKKETIESSTIKENKNSESRFNNGTLFYEQFISKRGNKDFLDFSGGLLGI
jgi:hypothetical protein